MRLQILSSGSEGNSALVRAGETTVLVDAGLPRTDMEARLDSAGLAVGAIDHVLVTHGHLDHARSAGLIARRDHALLHCAEVLMRQASARRAKRFSTVGPGKPFEVASRLGEDAIRFTPVLLPHDADPTLAYKFEHAGRTAVILTDIGNPSEEVARSLSGAHVLALEFNYEPELMETGPYPAVLKKRITGDRGHLSNGQAARMLELLAGPELHTLLIAHISKKTNRPEIALATAHATLDRLGIASRVRVIVASQEEIGESLEV